MTAASRESRPDGTRSRDGGSSRPTARRQLTAVALGMLSAGGLALIAGGQTWARVVAARPAPLPPVQSSLSGGEAAPLVPAAGLVLLAATLAVLAMRGPARLAVGLLVAAAGGVLAWSGLRTLAGGVEIADGRVTHVDLALHWPALTVVAGVLGIAAGALVVVRGRSWPGMGRRYERSGADTRPAGRSDEDRTQDAWKALDRGEDPTDPEPAPPRWRT